VTADVQASSRSVSVEYSSAPVERSSSWKATTNMSGSSEVSSIPLRCVKVNDSMADRYRCAMPVLTLLVIGFPEGDFRKFLERWYQLIYIMITPPNPGP